jgi:DNA-directed RNA polymerase subunit alpha
VLGYCVGGAVTALKVKGASHEYHIMDGVKDSVLDIMLNFKKLRFIVDENVEQVQWIAQRFKGVGIYTGSDLKLPSGVKLLNEDTVLLEISDPSTEFVADLRLEK